MIEMIPGLSTVLSYLQNERQYKSQKYDEALHALHKAVHETNKYINGTKHNVEQELELSNLWGQAAIKARNLSKDLAKRCYIKSEYWQDPDSWSFSKIKSDGICLTRIENELRDLISK